MSNKWDENVRRIRALDADVWRTINGAHVLIDGDSGEVKGGAGGKLNGRKLNAKGMAGGTAGGATMKAGEAEHAMKHLSQVFAGQGGVKSTVKRPVKGAEQFAGGSSANVISIAKSFENLPDGADHDLPFFANRIRTAMENEPNKNLDDVAKDLSTEFLECATPDTVSGMLKDLNRAVKKIKSKVGKTTSTGGTTSPLKSLAEAANPAAPSSPVPTPASAPKSAAPAAPNPAPSAPAVSKAPATVEEMVDIKNNTPYGPDRAVAAYVVGAMGMHHLPFDKALQSARYAQEHMPGGLEKPMAEAFDRLAKKYGVSGSSTPGPVFKPKTPEEMKQAMRAQTRAKKKAAKTAAAASAGSGDIENMEEAIGEMDGEVSPATMSAARSRLAAARRSAATAPASSSPLATLASAAKSSAPAASRQGTSPNFDDAGQTISYLGSLTQNYGIGMNKKSFASKLYRDIIANNPNADVSILNDDYIILNGKSYQPIRSVATGKWKFKEF